MILPKTLKPERLTVVIDTREQLPFEFSPMNTVVGTLPTGDYSILGLERKIAVERKSLSDLLGCMGSQRDRFEENIQRLLSYPARIIICEGSLDHIDKGEHRSRMDPNAIYGTILGWQARGVPIVMAGSRDRAQRMARQFLWIAARRCYDELVTFQDSI